MPQDPHVIAVCQDARHRFSKRPALQIHVLAGLGVEGDAHFGPKTQHRFDKRSAPERPNLRQVHLIDAALFEDLRRFGLNIGPGDLGENITTTGADLTKFPVGTIVQIGDLAQIALTGLRQPCVLLDRFRPGLQHAVAGQTPAGEMAASQPFMRFTVMARVLRSGIIHPQDRLVMTLPPRPHRPLENI